MQDEQVSDLNMPIRVTVHPAVKITHRLERVWFVEPWEGEYITIFAVHRRDSSDDIFGIARAADSNQQVSRLS